MENLSHAPSSKSKGLFWLASYPKSGNTWMRVLLHNYDITENLPCDINKMNHLTVGADAMRWYEIVLKKDKKDINASDIQHNRTNVQKHLFDKFSGIGMVKTHNLLACEDGYPLINLAVTRGVIYIIRNPLDVVLSWSAHIGRSVDDTIDIMGAENLRTPGTESVAYEVIGSWSQHVSSWTSSGSSACMIVRYEDMLDDIGSVFSKVIKHIGLDLNEERLDKAILFSSFEQLSALEEKSGFVERSKHSTRFFRSGTKDQWKNSLTPIQIEKVIQSNSQLMQKYGYLPL